MKKCATSLYCYWYWRERRVILVAHTRRHDERKMDYCFEHKKPKTSILVVACSRICLQPKCNECHSVSIGTGYLLSSRSTIWYIGTRNSKLSHVIRTFLYMRLRETRVRSACFFSSSDCREGFFSEACACLLEASFHTLDASTAVKSIINQ